jgi:hypothetical protein
MFRLVVYLRYRQLGLSIKESRLLLYRRVGCPRFKPTSDTGQKVISRYRPEGHPQVPVQSKGLRQVHCCMLLNIQKCTSCKAKSVTSVTGR